MSRRSRSPDTVLLGRRLALLVPAARPPYTPACDDRSMKKFTVTIEGANWKDIQELELFDLPKEGDTVETRYGTCIVTEAELQPDSGERAGKIVCRLP
jgi:hypothetical protein